MKYNNYSHPGNMPIRVLRFNIAERFENIRPEVKEMQIRDVLKDKLISREIIVAIDKEYIKSPYADCQYNRICLTEPFISYLWVIIYYFFNIHEHIMYRQSNKNWDGKIDYSNDILKRSFILFDWALTLRYRYSEWNMKLPNPDFENSVLNEDEKNIILKVNNLFLDSLSYIMFHEYAHIVNGHCESYKILKGKKNLSETELSQLIEFEKEADNFAFETIIKDYDDEKYRKLKGIAIILAHIAMLFLHKDPKGIIQINHPDTDSRLLSVIDKIFLEEDESKYYIRHLTLTACNIFFNLHNIKLHQKGFDTVNDMLVEYLQIFDSIKK